MAELSAERKGRITASSIGAICGLSPYATRDDAMRRMVREYYGAEPEFTGNIATDWGHAHEQDALNALTDCTGSLVSDIGFCGLEVDGMMIGATPDGMLDDGTLVEVKCPFGSRNVELYANEYLDSRPDYRAQVQWQLMCSGKEKTAFGVWTLAGFDYMYLSADEKQQSELLEKAREFWGEYQSIIASAELSAQYLTTKEKQYTERDDDEYVDASSAYLAAIGALAIAEEAVKVAREKLLEVCGGENTTGCGLTVCASERKGAVDYKKVPELQGVDLEQYRKKSSTIWTVKTVGDKQ